jgi:hypothetical protein
MGNNHNSSQITKEEIDLLTLKTKLTRERIMEIHKQFLVSSLKKSSSILCLKI